MYFVYVIWSNKLKKRYIGSTKDIAKRIKEHNSGKTKFTKGGIPWIKIYEEEFQTKTEAIKREKYLKSGQGRAWLDNKLSDF